MKFPTALRNGEEFFLGFLESTIDEKDLAEFFKESGFISPNEFPESEMRKILFEKKFPTSNLREFGWAIYECGTDRMRTYERHIRIFACSIYLYSRHLQEWGGDFAGEYCYLMIADSIRNGDAKELRALIIFFEWLDTFVNIDNPINNYPLLIGWLLVKCRLGEAHEDFVRIVLNHLKDRIGDQYLLVGDSYGFGVDDWFGLIEMIPGVDCLDRDLVLDLIYRPSMQSQNK